MKNKKTTTPSSPQMPLILPLGIHTLTTPNSWQPTSLASHCRSSFLRKSPMWYHSVCRRLPSFTQQWVNAFCFSVPSYTISMLKTAADRQGPQPFPAVGQERTSFLELAGPHGCPNSAETPPKEKPSALHHCPLQDHGPQELTGTPLTQLTGTPPTQSILDLESILCVDWRFQ